MPHFGRDRKPQDTEERYDVDRKVVVYVSKIAASQPQYTHSNHPQSWSETTATEFAPGYWRTRTVFGAGAPKVEYWSTPEASKREGFHALGDDQRVPVPPGTVFIDGEVFTPTSPEFPARRAEWDKRFKPSFYDDGDGDGNQLFGASVLDRLRKESQSQA